MDSIRDKYKKYGVKTFYQFHGDEYINPHGISIDKAIKFVYDNWDLDFSNVLDLMCGDGIVTKTLDELGVKDIMGIDGFLCDQYKKKTGNPCSTMTFDDIILHGLTDKYSLIICSYSLHLLNSSKLPLFLYQLSNVTDDLLILGPSKKPEIKIFWELENEKVIDKVKIRHYHKM